MYVATYKCMYVYFPVCMYDFCTRMLCYVCICIYFCLYNRTDIVRSYMNVTRAHVPTVTCENEWDMHPCVCMWVCESVSVGVCVRACACVCVCV